MINIAIEVAPDGYTFDDKPEVYGKVFSSSDEIVVNKTNWGYTILYHESVFSELNKNKLSSNIVALFKKNLPNEEIRIGTEYLPFSKAFSDEDFESDVESVLSVLEFSSAMLNVCENEENIEYFRSKTDIAGMKYIADYEEANKGAGTSVIKASDLDDDDNYEIDPALKFLMNGDLDSYLDDEDDNYRDKKKKKKKSKSRNFDGYGTSKSIKAANNPKRSYKRHGVVVCKDKGAIKRDEKIIKEFLKDFIPGDSSWKKALRRDVLNRWIRTYAISKKTLKGYEKSYRKSKNKNKKRTYYSSINTERAYQLTRNLLSNRIDRWNDPTR